ncbi:hypothetical protein CU024_2642 [Enterococcus faecium]|nr:hypothetical protein AOA13_p58 [Listeria monocytogenes]MBK4751173.1 hypothetical protein [Enterococcus faecium]MBL4990427.1 hypothetical protein [Enterococcus lactis]UCK60367.1 hypothetical protein pLIS19_00251 [Listeria innocua]MBK4753710.1 hypothetical protein [Enterococcus faecium]
MFEFDIRRQQHSKKRYNLVEHHDVQQAILLYKDVLETKTII